MPVKRHVIFTNWQSIPRGYVAVDDPAMVARARAAYEQIAAKLELEDDALAREFRIELAAAPDARVALLHELAAWGPDSMGGEPRSLVAAKAMPDPGVGFVPLLLF